MPATTARPSAPARPSARDRLLAAADQLFYDEGIQTVGIDRVIEQAGVAKASLYNTFGSKEELIRAYLESRHARIVERITRVVERFDTPRDKLLGVFDAQAEVIADPDYRGCAFARASAEAPVGGCVARATDDYRVWLRTLLTGLAAQAGAGDAPALAHQLHFLYDGAGQSARMDRDPAVPAAVRAAATALIDAAIPAG
jgi:AcrR family transcriptional regulator